MPMNTAPVTMISPGEALALVRRHVPRPQVERVALAHAQGRVLAVPVEADRDYPPFDRAMMDGYGVRLADAGGWAAVVAEAAPGAPWAGRLHDGQAVALMTGAPCPAGVQAIVPVEQAERHEERVRIPAPLAAGRHIARKGSECPLGQPVLDRGARLTPLAVAVLATVGAAQPLVYARPAVAVIATGNELTDAGEQPDWHRIRDSNQPMLCALLGRLGIDAPRLLRAPDDPRALAERIAECDDCPIVILTGGVSAGRYDAVPQVAAALGWRIVFHKVRQKPGKPLLFAVREGRVLFGLPGNPLAAHLCAQRYVAPAVRRMSGHPFSPARAAGRMLQGWSNPGGRDQFVLARVTAVGTHWQIAPLPARGSADLFTPCQANALLCVPAGLDLAPRQETPFEWLAGAGPEAGWLP